MHPFFVVSFLLLIFLVPFPVLLFVFLLFVVGPRYTYSCRSFYLLFVWLGFLSQVVCSCQLVFSLFLLQVLCLLGLVFWVGSVVGVVRSCGGWGWLGVC